MAFKKIITEDLGEIRLYKRRGTRSLRLSISPQGYVRVSLPAWLPYSAGLSFAKQREAWIKQHLAPHEEAVIKDGDRIGKSHQIVFKATAGVARTQIKNSQITVLSAFGVNDARTQAKAKAAAELALKKESEKLFPQQLKYLAGKHGFKYKELKIRKMTSRWGSCSSKGVITLSTYLVQLPWELIDYVMVHELLHTRHMHHGPKFWADFEAIIPGAKKLRKKVNEHKPRLVIN